jgi:hypothetical protein
MKYSKKNMGTTKICPAYAGSGDRRQKKKTTVAYSPWLIYNFGTRKGAQ